MLRPRQRYQRKRFSMYHIAAMQIQYTWRNFCQHKFIHLNQPGAKDAAAVLQRSWRRYTNQRIYKYYKDLIAFRNSGDPSLMLRAINPKESGLVDCAAGIHIRFRLGGHLFPPTIYYKIFTHNGICDVGAFAPRDYTRHKAVDAGDRHNNQSGGNGQTLAQGSIRVGNTNFATNSNSQYADADTRGWYRRHENNGWRPVTVKVLRDAEEDVVAQETAGVDTEFHYSKLKRKEDKDLKRKLKKRDWMQKMYEQGRKGEDGGEELEMNDDDLLKWSNALDFDAYLDGWKHLATSGASDARLDESISESGLPTPQDFAFGGQ